MSDLGIGVDWASGNWLVVAYKPGDQLWATVEPNVEAVWENHGSDTQLTAIDVPIGLLSKQDDDYDPDEPRSRDCDVAARDVVGPARGRSVFNAPAREAIEAYRDDDSDDATLREKNEEAVGKGLSSQSIAIMDAIAEVDAFLCDDDGPLRPDALDASVPIVESHPEVCFRAFAGEELAHSKNSAPGVAERLAALEDHLDRDPEAVLRELCADLVETNDGDDVDLDDVLDALALAVTVAGREADLATLPEKPPLDGEKLPMQMVYNGDLHREE